MQIFLKTIPDGFYRRIFEVRYKISENVYLVKQSSESNDTSLIKYLMQISINGHNYETLITYNLYDNILSELNTSEIKHRHIYEYLFGKDTIRVVSESDFPKGTIVAIGPDYNKLWQKEFSKYCD